MEKEKFNDDLNQNLFKQYSLEKSNKIRNNIVVLNQPLVSYIIGKYYLESIKVSSEIKNDMYQEGIMGLMHAIDKFDLNFGCKFSTYSTWWIKQRINNFLSANSTIQIPNHIKADQNKLLKQLNKEGKNIIELNEEDIKNYNLSNKKLSRIKNASSTKKIISLQANVGSKNETYTYEEVIEDPSESPENSFDKKFMISTVKEALKLMPEKRKLILLLRYGVIKEKELRKLNEEK